MLNINQAYIQGFLKEAQRVGCTLGQAWDIYKCAANGTYPAPASSLGAMNQGGLSNTSLPAPTGSLGMSGANNSVTTTPSAAVNTALNKPVTPSNPTVF